MKKKVLTAAIAAMCFVGTVSVVPIVGVAENVQEQTVLTENNDVIYGIGVSKEPDKTTYKIGEQLDLTGLRLNGSYRMGELISTIIDEDYQELLNSNVPIKIDASEFDNTKAGRYHIYVIYGNTKNSFTVTVYDDAINTTIAVTETKPVTTITTSVNDPSLQISVVTVTIMDISGDNILVKPVDGSPELKSSNKFSLSSKQLPANLNPKVGMKLEILYSGGINETYPAQFANVQKITVVSETANDKEAQKPLISEDDILELSKKGDELTWSDFEKYEFTDIGDGTNIWQFVIKNSGSKLLVIGRDLKEKPEHINCVWGNGAEFDIRTEDLTPWFYDDSSSINGDANSNGNETCYSGGNCEDGEMIVPETEDGKTVTEVFIQFNDNVKTLKIPATVNKVDIIKCLNLVKIEVSKDNPYLCTVDGVIYSKDMKKLVFYPSSKSGTEFIVPDTVEVIGEGAFNYAQNLKTVKLPDGVKIIKDSAFFGTKITDFELPETLTDIEQYAFSENNSLTSITLPASLKHAESPFLECGALTEIVILHEMGDEHFESSGPRNPDDDYYSALLRNGSNITVFVPDNSYEDYNKYYKDRWKCKNILPLSKYEKNTIKGDTNCDGSVDMADVVLIMQALANPNKYGINGTAEHHLTEQGRLNADVDGDGLTVGDAQSIQLKLLGIVESKTNSDLKDIVSIRTPYDPIMSNWSGIGILLEFDSSDYQITLFAEDGHFTYWDINKGSGPIKDVGITYEVGKNGYIFWTPDDLKYPDDYETEIIVKGTSSNKSVELGRIYITGGERSTLIASLEKPDSAIDPMQPEIQPLGVGGIDEAITLISNYDLNNYDKVYHDSYKKMFERFKNDGFIYQVTENETIKENNNRGVALFPYAKYEDIGVGYYVTFKEKNYHIMFYYADAEVLTETEGIAEYLKKRMGRSSDKIVKIQDKDVSLLFPENGQCYANAFIDKNHYFDVIGAVSEDELIEFLNAFEYGKLNLKSDKRLKLIDDTIKSINVTSLPKGYDFTFTDSKAQKFIDFLSDMELTDEFSEDPGQLNGMTWVIKLEYQNNDTMTLYDIGGYIRSENDSWLKYEYDYDSPLDTLIWELSK